VTLPSFNELDITPTITCRNQPVQLNLTLRDPNATWSTSLAAKVFRVFLRSPAGSETECTNLVQSGNRLTCSLDDLSNLDTINDVCLSSPLSHVCGSDSRKFSVIDGTLYPWPP
jgi:hypothetical protein